MKVKKDNPKITSLDVYRYVAQQSSLKQEQVKECFKAFADILINLSENENRPDKMIIMFPYLGWFEFREKRGKAKGSVKMIPSRKDENGNALRFVSEEDSPSYERLDFHVKKNIQESIKEKSIKKKIKQENAVDFNFGKNNE